MPADIRLAIIAALSQGQQNGYGLRRKIAEMFGPFFGASQGALYPAVAKCLAAEEIREISGATPGRAASGLDKRVFQLTEKGARELRSRLAMLTGTETVRSDFLMAMTMADYLTEEEILRLVDERVAELHGSTRSAQGTTSAGSQFVRRYQQAVSRAAIEFLKGEGQAILRAALRDRTS
ncbi:MAG: PadR family transcriptional regulator [Alphaproteobacteria bacterium]|nr:PadR family transcriptional regulator [Alphaproteobacteria bacterium]